MPGAAHEKTVYAAREDLVPTLKRGGPPLPARSHLPGHPGLRDGRAEAPPVAAAGPAPEPRP